MSKIIIQAVKGGTIITVDGLKINPYTLDSGLFLKKDNYTSNYPGSITYTVVDKAGERAFNPELLSNITLISLNSEETIPKNEEELLNILSEFDGFKKFGASSGGKGNSIVGAGIDCINKKIELKMSDGTDFPIDLSCMFQDVVKSTKGLTADFPENPKVGHIFYVDDADEDVQKSWQFNGKEWVVLGDFLSNFKVTFADSYYSLYKTEDTFKNLYNNNEAITLLKFNANDATNTIDAYLLQDFSKNTTPFTLTGVTSISKLSPNEYAFNLDLSDDVFKYSNTFSIDSRNYLKNLNFSFNEEGSAGLTTPTSIDITNNARLDNINISGFYAKKIDSFHVTNNNTLGDTPLSISLYNSFNNLNISENNNVSDITISVVLKNDGSYESVSGVIDLSRQTISGVCKIETLDLTKAIISYPSFTSGATIYLRTCKITDEQLIAFYDYLIASEVKNATIYNRSDKRFTEEQKNTLVDQGYTVYN